MDMKKQIWCAGVLTALVGIAANGAAQQRAGGPASHPAVVVDGQTYTPASILSRNMGTPEDQESQFPPHKIVGDVYYVGTKTLSSFLIVTRDGNILMDTTYERNAPVIIKSIEALGFKVSDIKYIIGNHAHADHQEGDALLKLVTRAPVVAMSEDVPALKAMMPGGKEHPVDKILHDGETLTLGGTTLTAHLTAGHTRGATTWTMKTTEGGKSYDVVFFSSLRAGGVVTAPIQAELDHSFAVVKNLPCDVPLGDHPAEYRMHEKYLRLKPGAVNPFIDKAGCLTETRIQEAMYKAVLEEQAAASKP